MNNDTKNGFRLGRWQVYPLRNLLVGSDGDVHIEPKVMQVLQSLVSNPGQVVERDKLLNDVWGGRAFSDEPLTRCIAALRRALRDSPKDPHYIQTIPKSGYRLVCPVESLERATDDVNGNADEPSDTHKGSLPTSRRRIALLTFFGLILVAAVYVAYRFTLVTPTESPQLIVDGTTRSEPPVYSIAVLPFVNLSSDPEQEYFSDGISEELLNLLSRTPGLRVAARTSSFQFRGRNVAIGEIGKQLHVGYVVEGSVRRAGNRLRISAQLINTKSGFHIWSDTFERELSDVFAMQDEISGSIAKALRVTLGAGKQEVMPPAQKPTEDLEAYELYLRGRYFWQRRGEDNIRQAIELFERATALDPQFARAWSGLAAAHATLWFYSDVTKAEGYPLAVSAAHKALALDDTMAEAYAVLGDAAYVIDRKYAEGEAYFLRAIANEPENATAHLWYGGLLAAVGRNRDALNEVLIAFELDPLNIATNDTLARHYSNVNDNSNVVIYGALAWERGPIEGRIDGGHIEGLYELMWAHVRLEEFGRAIDLAEQLDEIVKLPLSPLTLLVEAMRDPAKGPLFLKMLTEHESTWFSAISLPGYVIFGRIDDAYRLANLDRRGNSWMYWRPEMAPFRQDPRFENLVTELGLMDYWRENGWPDACRPEGDSLSCE